MVNKKIYRLVFSCFALALFGLLPITALAEIIDDMTARTDANGEVDLVVRFAFQIQYLRNFPQGKTDYSAIYFNALSTVPPDEWQNYESHRAPSSDVIQDVNVSTMDKATGPTIQLKLKRSAEVSVRLGSNGQSLLIHIKPDVVAASPVALAAIESPPSGEITAPKVVLPATAQKLVHIPLGGKDGLPVFPDIEQPVQTAEQAVPPPSAPPSLADQIVKANTQASALMIQSGNALLTGQTFIAIDSLNSILKMQPNKYTEDAQLWIGVSRERVGQLPKAILEFTSYLKLYPNGKYSQWTKERLALYKVSQPALFASITRQTDGPAQVNTEMQYSEFGSLSMEGYLGASQTTSIAPVGNTMVPTTVSATDQKSVISNVSLTARANNNEYDNRIVFQDFYSANYLPGQTNTSRLGAAFYEVKDRIDNYSFKVGRQSGSGGGVMGRFDGISAGYGISPDYRVDIAAGQLSDVTTDEQPKFAGASLDFGMRQPMGGSVYYIDQTVYGITERKAVGGNLRYFEPAFSVMSMLDYDLQFSEINFMTVQGTLNGGGKSNDYNFMLDRRKSPMLDLRNAISGTTSSITTLIQNGSSVSDLLTLVNQRTTASTLASAGMVNHLNDKWTMGTDVSYSITDALEASGLLDGNGHCVDPAVGCMAASPSSGPAWSISQRLTGLGVIRPRDVTNFSVNYTRTETSTGESLQISNHMDMAEKWSLDTSVGVNNQSDSTGGKSNNLAPTARVSYRMRNDLSLDSQLGLTWSTTSNSSLSTSSKTFQDFLSFGFRFDF
jgi:hypothetical protein